MSINELSKFIVVFDIVLHQSNLVAPIKFLNVTLYILDHHFPIVGAVSINTDPSKKYDVSYTQLLFNQLLVHQKEKQNA